MICLEQIFHQPHLNEDEKKNELINTIDANNAWAVVLDDYYIYIADGSTLLVYLVL